jgi:uncharacterized protein YjbJ (UPF0337 family)
MSFVLAPPVRLLQGWAFPVELFGRLGVVMKLLSKGIRMDKDRIKGAAEQAKGAVKEVAGKVTGDAKLEAEGKADKAAGKVQNAVGGIKDTLRGK